MYFHSFSGLSFLSFLSLAASQKIQFDGRVASGTAATAFDTDNGLFQPKNVFGQNLTFGKLLKLPSTQGSIFDQNTVPVEITLRYVPHPPAGPKMVDKILFFRGFPSTLLMLSILPLVMNPSLLLAPTMSKLAFVVLSSSRPPTMAPIPPLSASRPSTSAS